jgi:hypothetical protein
MNLVLTENGINDDVIVVGGDNLFSDDLFEFGRVLPRDECSGPGRL